jgi:hypothetical protein
LQKWLKVKRNEFTRRLTDGHKSVYNWLQLIKRTILSYLVTLDIPTYRWPCAKKPPLASMKPLSSVWPWLLWTESAKARHKGNCNLVIIKDCPSCTAVLHKN